jgi:hypothetical protein
VDEPTASIPVPSPSRSPPRVGPLEGRDRRESRERRTRSDDVNIKGPPPPPSRAQNQTPPRRPPCVTKSAHCDVVPGTPPPHIVEKRRPFSEEDLRGLAKEEKIKAVKQELDRIRTQEAAPRQTALPCTSALPCPSRTVEVEPDTLPLPVPGGGACKTAQTPGGVGDPLP